MYLTLNAVEPLWCSHPWDPLSVSWLEGCPYFRGCLICFVLHAVSTLQWMPLFLGAGFHCCFKLLIKVQAALEAFFYRHGRAPLVCTDVVLSGRDAEANGEQSETTVCPLSSFSVGNTCIGSIFGQPLPRKWSVTSCYFALRSGVFVRGVFTFSNEAPLYWVFVC